MRAWPLAAALLLTGCGTQSGAWGQYFQIVRESWRNTTGSGVITMEQAAAVPYASLAYRVNGSNEAMLVLATDTNGDQMWTAASRVVLLTRDGRVLRSVGLPRDKGGTAPEQSNMLPAPAQALKGPVRSRRQADFPDIGMHNLILNCVATARRREVITILGTAIATTRVDESCESLSPRWRFTDQYWLDTDGFVWQSLQHLHPVGTRIQIKIMRPPE